VIDWIATLRKRLAVHDVVVVTVAQTRGSAPREAGARMLVGPDHIDGSIGGGHLEFEAIRIARDALGTHDRRGSWLVRFPLAARLGQCCGGVVTLLFQPVTPADAWLDVVARSLATDGALTMVTPVADASRRPMVVGLAAAEAGALGDDIQITAAATAMQSEATPSLISNEGGTYLVERVVVNDFRIMLFGNGHVGRALSQVLGTLPCNVTWVDQREHAFPSMVPDNVTVVATDAPEDEVGHAASEAMFLVMTHSHSLDFALTTAILGRDDFRYFGLIGSAAKRAQFERRLSARGIPAERLRRMTCPIGIGGIASKQPGAIAVAVAAQLLALRESAVITRGRAATAA
jgi:xanthine dehydrogenase accessory factor